MAISVAREREIAWQCDYDKYSVGMMFNTKI